MDIKCTVQGQKLTIISPRPLPQGSDNFDRFLFTLSDDWDGLMVFAQFRQGDQVSNEYLTDVTVDGQAYQAATVPNWLEPGLATMTLYGTGRENVIGTTNYVVMRVQATGFMGEAVTSDLTETLYQQMVNRFIAYEWRYDIVRDFQGAWEALLASIDSPANTWTELPVKAAAEAPASPADGDYWWDTTNSLLKKYVVTEGVGAWETITGLAAEATAPPDVYYYYNTATGKLYRTPITAIPVATTTTVGGIKLDPDNFRIGNTADDGAGNEGKLYLKTDTALTGEGKPADAATVGAAVAKRPRLIAYTSGTSLDDLPGNSFCPIFNLADYSVPVEDLPAGLRNAAGTAGLSIYAWVETLGEDGNKRRMQRISTTRSAISYVRYFRPQTVEGETVWSWTPVWYSFPVDSDLTNPGEAADAAVVGAALANANRAIGGMEAALSRMNGEIDVQYVAGGISKIGAETDTTNLIHTKRAQKITSPTYLVVMPPYKVDIAIFDYYTITNTHLTQWVDEYGAFKIGVIDLSPYQGQYVAYRIINSDTPTADISDEVATVQNYVKLISNAGDANTTQKLIETIADYDRYKLDISFKLGGFNNSGVSSDSTLFLGLTAPILIEPGMYVYIRRPFEAQIAFFKKAEYESSPSQDNFIGFMSPASTHYVSGMIKIPETYTVDSTTYNLKGKAFSIRCRMTLTAEASQSGNLGSVGNYVSVYAPTRRSKQTLLTPYRRAGSYRWDKYTRIDTDGNLYQGYTASKHAYTSEYVDIAAGTEIYRTTGYAGADDPTRLCYIYACEYNGDTFVQRTELIPYTFVKMQSETTRVRFCCILNSSTMHMSKGRLDGHFGVRFAEKRIRGDGTTPLYLAFGASTTVGAVKNTTDEEDFPETTYAPNDYPTYIGQALGLRALNYGQGTTGFMARDDGKKPNFLDQIYLNRDKLEEAALVTLVFGYGNDSTAGLPIGEWDDYFPFDEYPAKIYSASNTDATNDANMHDLIDAGATLFGCLNWAIRFITANYPHVMLMCICGAPNYAHQRSIAIQDNKIVVTMPQSNELGDKFDTLMSKLCIPNYNLTNTPLPFGFYASDAHDENGIYKIFSTKNGAFDTHPNEVGYQMWARFLAGKVAAFFTH